MFSPAGIDVGLAIIIHAVLTTAGILRAAAHISSALVLREAAGE